MLIDRPDRPADLTVTVYGQARTKGSAASFVPRRGDGSIVTKGNGQPMVVQASDQNAKAWAGAVSAAAAGARDENAMPFLTESGVWLELTFVRPRNKGHYGSGRNHDIVKDGAPAYPSTRPDVDKLERNVLDALKGVLYADDGQVVALHSMKVFGDPARLELALWTLPATVADQRLAGQSELVAA